ncbi:MAG: hypoxanthine-guanine phosphoribosyltransferase [Gammaproteobacteria bacterium]|nr:hypoxanthine-guanine phosphoribosyltransferase [Gammaproteobacteria bacterium]
MSSDLHEALEVKRRAICLHSAEEIEQAYQRLAAEISAQLAEKDPIVLCIMNGGLMPTAALLNHMHIPIELDYLHATRYRNELQGGEDIHWLAYPQLNLKDRVVLIVDDIFDEGHTMLAVKKYCQQQGASEVLVAVLVNKKHARKVKDIEPDFIGLHAEDKFLFGAGMDYMGHFRNLPEIYAVTT